VGEKFLTPVLDNIARHTAHTAVFACLTKPSAASRLKSRTPLHWQHTIARRMRVLSTSVALAGIEGFERAVIAAKPKS
jgi:hypothetical protein